MSVEREKGFGEGFLRAGAIGVIVLVIMFIVMLYTIDDVATMRVKHIQEEAIKSGNAQYNPKTAQFEWLPRN